jgi:hypothetical protein
MRLSLLSVFLLAAAGCTPVQHVTVTGWNDGKGISNKSYCLAPDKDVVKGDLEYDEYAVYARRLLAERGYTETDCSKAKVLISLAYGVGGRSQSHSYPEPYYGEEGPPRATFFDPQRYTVMGTEGYPGTPNNYVRFVRMAAYDMGPGGSRGPQRWRIDASSIGAGTDLRRIVPFLMAGARGYIGTDTGRSVRTDVKENAPGYQLVTGGKP